MRDFPRPGPIHSHSASKSVGEVHQVPRPCVRPRDVNGSPENGSRPGRLLGLLEAQSASGGPIFDRVCLLLAVGSRWQLSIQNSTPIPGLVPRK